MNIFKLFSRPRDWKCNVIACEFRVDYSGGVCARCEQHALDFQSTQINLDRRFVHYSNTEFLSNYYQFPIPKDEKKAKFMQERLAQDLHRRDSMIAKTVNKMWIEKLT